MTGDQQAASAGVEAFSAELEQRVQEARSSLHEAQAQDDPLLVQIAESHLEDLQALAERNDVPLPVLEDRPQA